MLMRLNIYYPASNNLDLRFSNNIFPIPSYPYSHKFHQKEEISSYTKTLASNWKVLSKLKYYASCLFMDLQKFAIRRSLSKRKKRNNLSKIRPLNSRDLAIPYINRKKTKIVLMKFQTKLSLSFRTLCN